MKLMALRESGVVMKSSNASASEFGWDFQSNAAIVLMMKNIKTASNVKVEGLTEDIEITLDNGKRLFSQAKSVFDPEDTTHVLTKLQDGLKTLNVAARETGVERLIYVTNSPNPFNNPKTMYAFCGGVTILDYASLPNDCQTRIEKHCTQKGYMIDFELLSVCVIQFNGDDENRYRIIKDLTNEFLHNLGVGNLGLGAEILAIWQRWFRENASQHNMIATISKKQMIWPLIVSVCDISSEDALLADCDDADFNEISHRYNAVISNNAERFEFITKVMSSYGEFKTELKSRERTKSFIDACWKQFENEYGLFCAEDSLRETVIKLTISKVIKSRYAIDSIKKGVNL